MSSAPHDSGPPPGPKPGANPAAAQVRADAMTTGLRRGLWPIAAIALVIAAQAIVQVALSAPGNLDQAGFFALYSVLMLGMLPILVTLAAAGATALLSKEPLPAPLIAVIAGVITGAWVAWISGGWLGVLFGVVLGVTTIGTALVFSRDWPLLVRLPVAVVVSVVGGLAIMLVGAAVL